MNSNAFFDILQQAGAAHEAASGAAPATGERQEGRWRVLPLEGTFEIVYEDSRGAWSTRRVEARALKLGPGRTLLGGIDRGRGGYRGFRADRIRRLTDPASTTRIEAGILDWLLARAEAQRRERAAQIRALSARRRPVKTRAEPREVAA
jgi:predicted DNA-binding transcriptional regulator YafY